MSPALGFSRRMLAFVVCAFGLGMALTWIDARDLLVLTSTPRPERMLNGVILLGWLALITAAVQWILPPRASDFGAGLLSLLIAAFGISVFWAWNEHRHLFSPVQPGAEGERVLDVALAIAWLFGVMAATQWLMLQYKRRAQAARNARPRQGPFSLYLRPFELDRVMETWSANVILDIFTPGMRRQLGIEEHLAQLVDNHWPLVAVGDSVVGAQKLHSTDEAWREEVHKLMREAEMIFFIPGPSPGAVWEALSIADHDKSCIGRTFWFMPELSEFSEGFDAFGFCQRAREALAAVGIHLPDDFEPGSVCRATYLAAHAHGGGAAVHRWLGMDWVVRLEQEPSRKTVVIDILREAVERISAMPASPPTTVSN